MDTHFLLIVGHIVGTILGVGGATMIEVHLGKALKSGKMDPGGREYLGGDFRITRIGLVLSILTGLGLIVEYWLNNQLFRLENGVFWAKMAIVFIIAFNAYLLQVHKISLYWGSAFSFVSWWAAMLFGTFLTNGIKFIPQNQILSFLSLMLIYAVIIAIGAHVLHIIRERMKAPLQVETPLPQKQ